MQEAGPKHSPTQIGLVLTQKLVLPALTLCKKGCYTVLYNACIHVLCTCYTRVIRMCITLRMDTLYTVAYNNYSITPVYNFCITFSITMNNIMYNNSKEYNTVYNIIMNFELVPHFLHILVSRPLLLRYNLL